MSNVSTSEKFFEAKYHACDDPWEFATSDYEQGRYSAILKSISGRTFKRAFEPGCSIGVLTEQLAGMCSDMIALEISRTAVEKARLRCSHLRNVDVRHGALPADLPEGTFDLIVFSEIGYYFESLKLAALIDNLVARLIPGGLLLAAHWLGDSPDHLLSGDQVHEEIGRAWGLSLPKSERHPRFRIDQWVRE
jgi:SAM-dependent methyltransferase